MTEHVYLIQSYPHRTDNPTADPVTFAVSGSSIRAIRLAHEFAVGPRSPSLFAIKQCIDALKARDRAVVSGVAIDVQIIKVPLNHKLVPAPRFDYQQEG